MIMVVERSEYAAFQIEQECAHSFRKLSLDVQVADVRDEVRNALRARQPAPSIVFHAAAHKHVPLMERQGAEAMRTYPCYRQAGTLCGETDVRCFC